MVGVVGRCRVKNVVWSRGWWVLGVGGLEVGRVIGSKVFSCGRGQGVAGAQGWLRSRGWWR